MEGLVLDSEVKGWGWMAAGGGRAVPGAHHTVDYAQFVPLNSQGNVTKFAPHQDLKLIG